MTSDRFAPRPIVLEGSRVRLEPLRLEDAAEIFEAGSDPSIWDYLPRGPLSGRADAENWLKEALADQARGESVVFGIRALPSGALAGSTRFLDIRPPHRGLEIGWTWLAPAHQRSAVNTQAKLLLLAHAFDDLGAERVQLKTDARNLRSQRAIERIGATREGVLRRHLAVRDGYLRDSVYYSVIAPEWPRVRKHLESMLRTAARKTS